jgi:hypothetical protein
MASELLEYEDGEDSHDTHPLTTPSGEGVSIVPGGVGSKRHFKDHDGDVNYLP